MRGHCRRRYKSSLRVLPTDVVGPPNGRVRGWVAGGSWTGDKEGGTLLGMEETVSEMSWQKLVI